MLSSLVFEVVSDELVYFFVLIKDRLSVERLERRVFLDFLTHVEIESSPN
jgi:hypothetical protein